MIKSLKKLHKENMEEGEKAVQAIRDWFTKSRGQYSYASLMILFVLWRVAQEIDHLIRGVSCN